MVTTATTPCVIKPASSLLATTNANKYVTTCDIVKQIDMMASTGKTNVQIMGGEVSPVDKLALENNGYTVTIQGSGVTLIDWSNPLPVVVVPPTP